MASVLNEAYFHDEAAAFGALEAILWPHGPVCPHCKAKEGIGKLEGVRRLGCDEDKAKFEKKLGKIAKAKIKSSSS